MPTINQLVRKKRFSKKINLKKTPALGCNPQKHGTCISVFTKTPRKPNSALRKVAKVRLVNSRVITVYIPGEGHNISRFSDLLISGRRIRDLPGVKYGALRGKFDLSAVQGRKNSHSKYGVRKEKKDYILKNKKKRNRNLANRFYFKLFSKIYLLHLFGKYNNTDYQSYWRRSLCYLNLRLLTIVSKEIDSKGYFYPESREQYLRLYNYLEEHKKKYANKDPYKILYLDKTLLIVKDLEKKKLYWYNLKINK